MDVAKMLDAKAKTVQGLTGGIEHLFKKHKVEYFKGKGALGGPNEVAVQLNSGGVESLQTKNIIIATGEFRCWQSRHVFRYSTSVLLF